MPESTMIPELERHVVDSVRDRQTHFYGKYRGLVEEPDDSTAEDGKRMGRIRATVPAVYGDTVKSPWAMPCVPFAGDSHGLVLLPEKGDGVWIEFECGDPAMPIWSGCWWADNEMPDDGGVKKRALVTSKGLKLVLDDEDKSIELSHPGGAEVTITSSTITIKLSSKKIEITTSSMSVNDGALEVR
jgi:uncharacterized protein involved in type VI secretion and phage assembly